MSIDLRISVEPGFLRVVAMGELVPKDVMHAIQKVSAAVERYKATSVLFDGRGLAGTLTSMDRFNYGSFIAQLNRQLSLPIRPKIAQILPSDLIDPQRFGETVAVNRGATTKVFDNIEDALEWLGVVQASNQDTADV